MTTTPITDEQIAKWLEKRNTLLERRDGLYKHSIIDRIDAQLAQVPAGQNNEVDQALGRECAVQDSYIADKARRVVERLEAEYRRMSEGQPDGIIEHDDWLAGAP